MILIDKNITGDDFKNEIAVLFNTLIDLSQQSRRDGLLALEEHIDINLRNQFEILNLGLSLVIDGTDSEMISEILDNIINQYKYEETKIIGRFKKRGILGIQEGTNPRALQIILLSMINANELGLRFSE
jgi:flagellar motor component MotA